MSRQFDTAQPTASQQRVLARYNYRHFRTWHLLSDAYRTLRGAGLRPGEQAPGFVLPRADGGSLALNELRGRPVLLHFTSYSWPIAAGSVEPLKQLHQRWGQQVQFVEILVRQAHPGPAVPPYRSMEPKVADARHYLHDERVPWPVLVDALDGRVHRAYGGLSSPAYLLDGAGLVAFYCMWTHAPTLDRAIAALLAQDGSGLVLSGRSWTPHMLAGYVDGWRALRRGLPQSFIDLELAMPGSASLIWLGSRLRPLLAPLALRSRPLPGRTRLGLAGGTLLLAALFKRWAGRSAAARR